MPTSHRTRTALALGDALHLGGVPGVELGTHACVLAAARLGGNALGLDQRTVQRLTQCGAQGGGLALDLARHAPQHRTLALDHSELALERPGKLIPPGLESQRPPRRSRPGFQMGLRWTW